MRRFRQGLGKGQFVTEIVDVATIAEAFEQPVAFRPQLVAVAAGVDQGRTVREHRQRGCFGPGEHIRRTGKIAPGRGLQADHISTEGRVGGIQDEDLTFRVLPFQRDGQQYFMQFFGNGTGRIAARHPHHLHGEGAPTAYNLPGLIVLPRRPHHRRRIHTRMAMEMPVLKFKDGYFKTLRNLSGWREIATDRRRRSVLQAAHRHGLR
jgi:hypothetical protein